MDQAPRKPLRFATDPRLAALVPSVHQLVEPSVLTPQARPQAFTTVATTPVASVAAPVARVLLPDVLTSGVEMQWFDVVAIAQGVCDAIIQTAGSESSAPPLQRLVLTSLGTVEIIAGARAAGSPLALVRQVLEAALPENKPVQLRLFVLDPNSPAHVGTLRELSTALAYFERPGRSDLIRAVVNRYLARPSVPAEPAASVDIDKIEEPESGAPEARRAPRWSAPAIILVFGTGAFSLGVWWLTRANAASMLSASQSAVGGVREPGGRTGLVPAAPGQQVEAEPIDQKTITSLGPARVTGASRRTSSSASEGDVAVVAPIVPGASSALDGGDGTPVATGGGPGVGYVALPALVAPVGVPLVYDVVYDSQDPGVTPPNELWPRFPKLPAGTPRAEIAVFDLVIDENGHVESARAHTPLKRWDHVMLLSAMKTWRFEAATKDNHAVKYRKEIFVRAPSFWLQEP